MNQIIFLIAAVLISYPISCFAYQDPCRSSFEKRNYEVARIVCSETARVNPYAQYVLGEISLENAGHLTPKSVHWFFKAAGNGVVEAQRRLGEMSLSGEMGTKNYKEARKWYEMAAMQNDPESQLMFGMMLANGRGGEKDLVKGLMWLTLSAKSGSREAKEATKNVQEKMSPRQIIEANELVETLVETQFKTKQQAERQ